MDISELLERNQKLYNSILNFIETSEDSDNEFQKLVKIMKKQQNLLTKQQYQEILKLLFIIADNHYRTPNFFIKLVSIIQYFLEDPKFSVSRLEIFELLKGNKTFLLHFLDKCQINIKSIFGELTMNKELRLYLYPAIKTSFTEAKRNQIEEEIREIEPNLELFEQKCKKGENDSIICSLIRNDSIEEFIAYVTRNSISLSATIQPSFYETNSFLINKKVSLIEYATFFGSLQIIQYLMFNEVQLNNELWMYAIHSQNAELIHFLESNNVDCTNFDDVLIEAIKCHHNDFANYIIDNLIDINDFDLFNDLGSYIISSKNFHFYGENIQESISDLFSKPKTTTNGISRIASFLSYMFRNCFQLTSLVISSSSSENSNKILIPSSTNSLNSFGFNFGNDITSLKILGNIKQIPSRLFYKCSSLILVTIETSSSSINIEDECFYECSSIKKIMINTFDKSDLIGNTFSESFIGKYCFGGCSSLTQISIPSSVTSIGEYCFYRCSSLTQITIPSSVTSIGDRAFCECSSLTQITIPSSVISISNDCFCGCSSLTQIIIPSSVTSIGDRAFYGCSSLAQTTIPSSVTSIGDNCFSGCSSLTQITIPSSVTSIGNDCFIGCSSLIQITIPSSVTSIGEFCFCGCLSLEQISIQSPITVIKCCFFENCPSLESIEIPSSVTTIEDNAFACCYSLKRISIPDSLHSIGKGAFIECISLTEISLPSSLNKIENDVFKDCSAIRKITIPSSVTSIGDNAFYGCKLLKNVDIPSSVSSIGENAFR